MEGAASSTLVVFDTKLSTQQDNKHLGNGDTEEHGQRTERRLAAKWIRKSNKHGALTRLITHDIVLDVLNANDN